MSTGSMPSACTACRRGASPARGGRSPSPRRSVFRAGARARDRKSTRLNSSHGYISYAVFCLKKKKKTHNHTRDITAVKILIITHPAFEPLTRKASIPKKVTQSVRNIIHHIESLLTQQEIVAN